jgi:hypothetical protein
VTHQVINQPFLFGKPDFAAAGTRFALCITPASKPEKTGEEKNEWMA